MVDSTTEGFALEATGDPEKLDEFIDVMRSYGEIEVTRSGIVSMSLDNKKLRLSPPVPRARRRKKYAYWKPSRRSSLGRSNSDKSRQTGILMPKTIL